MSMIPERPTTNAADTPFTTGLKRWGQDVVDALGARSPGNRTRVPLPFEVRRGWEDGDSETSWGVHGGAIQVGSTIYTPDVSEAFGDGRRWQPIDDPDDLLTADPLDCTIYAAVVGGFVVFTTDPDVDGNYVTPIAILDGVRLVQLVVGNIIMENNEPPAVARMVFASPVNVVAESGGGSGSFDGSGTIEILTNAAIIDADADAGTITPKVDGIYLITCNVLAQSNVVDYFTRWKLIAGPAYGFSPLPLLINASRNVDGFLTGRTYPTYTVRDTICLAEIVRLEADTVLTVALELFDIGSVADVDFSCNHFAVYYIGPGDAYEEPT